MNVYGNCVWIIVLIIGDVNIVSYCIGSIEIKCIIKKLINLFFLVKVMV